MVRHRLACVARLRWRRSRPRDRRLSATRWRCRGWRSVEEAAEHAVSCARGQCRGALASSQLRAKRCPCFASSYMPSISGSTTSLSVCRSVNTPRRLRGGAQRRGGRVRVVAVRASPGVRSSSTPDQIMFPLTVAKKRWGICRQLARRRTRTRCRAVRVDRESTFALPDTRRSLEIKYARSRVAL